MTIEMGMIIFGVAFFHVFMRAFQQKNVMGNYYKMILPVSWLMQAATAAEVLLVVQNGLWVIPWGGTGAGLGAMAAMWLHTRCFGGKDK